MTKNPYGNSIPNDMENTNPLLCIFKEDAGKLAILPDATVGNVVKALLKYADDNCEPNFTDPLDAYVFQDLKRNVSDSPTGDAPVQAPETSDETVVQTKSRNCDCVPNIICTKEEFDQIIKDLGRRSNLLKDKERMLLKDMMYKNRNRGEDEYQDPFIYTSRMAREYVKNENYIYTLRDKLIRLGVMAYKGVIFPDGKFPINHYYLNEPALCEIIHDNVAIDDVQENGVESADGKTFVNETKNMKAELVYSTSGMLKLDDPQASSEVKVSLPELTPTEASYLRWLNEASKNKRNTYREGSKKFYCTFFFLSRHLSSKYIVPCRNSLVEKGYIKYKLHRKRNAFVYEILHYPEYLKCKSA